jgi:hypothetical protein
LAVAKLGMPGVTCELSRARQEESLFSPGSLKDIDSVAAEVARDIRNQYAIAYHSARASVDGYHTVKVEAHAQGHSKLTVYTRSGYFSRQSSSPNPKTDMK